ncbi:hypothetical protein KI387_003891, partial [Taxus chinensis]
SDDLKANILFQDCGLGNYFLTSRKEENLPLLIEEDKDKIWKMEFDGSHSSVGSGAGVVLYSPSNELYPFSYTLRFDNTNNTAEYEALLLGMSTAKD